jgi:ferric-dicitrate binding protein FerR (iron transport regulator)
MKYMQRFFILFLVAVSMVLVGCGSTGEPVAELENFSGGVKVKTQADASLTDAVQNQKVFNGGALQTDEEATAVLKFIKDSTQIKVSENTYFEIRDFSKKDLQQLRGVAIYQVSPQNTEMRIQTPHGVATVLGTTFRIDIGATGTALIVETGKVGFKNKLSSVVVESGQRFVTNQDKEPVAIDPFKLEELFSSDGKTKTYFNQR